jgi:hypothetical protein
MIIHPLILGEGRTLFDGAVDRLPLELTTGKTLRSGVVVQTYRPGHAYRSVM